MKKAFLLTVVFCVILQIAFVKAAQADYFYYKRDGSQKIIDVFDSLLAVRFDPYATPQADMFAQARPYLLDDFEFRDMPGGCKIFGIEHGYTLEYAMDQLRAESSVFMVNPVIIGTDSSEVYITNEIASFYKPYVTTDQIDSLNNIFGLEVFLTVGLDSIHYYTEYNETTDDNLLDICNALYETGSLEFVYPNFVYKANPEGIPQDPYFGYQWHLHNIGQTGGTVDCDIDMPEAFELAPIKMNRPLAIIDFGFEMDHEDLRQYLFTDKYDFVGDNINDINPDNDPSPDCDTIFAHCYHGTMMLGLISPMIDDTVGLSGIDDSTYIMPLKFADINGDTKTDIVDQALTYCMTPPHEALVVCCAWSLAWEDDGINQRFQELYNFGHPVFCAAGSKNNIHVKYPAYLPTVFSVGATDENDDYVYAYKPGTDTIDIMAPGKHLWSFDLSSFSGMNPLANTCNGDQDYYCEYVGTSCATAIVSALAAKIIATKPSLIPDFSNPDSLYSLLAHTTNDLGDTGYDIRYGWGRVNAYRAMIAISRGDANNDYIVDISDAVYIIDYVFYGGPEPIPYLYIGDTNCDGTVNVSDAVKIINYIFVGGDPPEICYLNLPE